jgi:hypothetical protein
MTNLPCIAAVRPTLLYRANCPKCRFLSAAIVVLSCGWVRRIPVDSPEALQLYNRFGQTRGRLALLYRGSFRTGWAIPVFTLIAVLWGVVGAGGRRLGGDATRDVTPCRHRAD